MGLYFVGRHGLGITDARFGLFVPNVAMYLAAVTAAYSLVVILFRRDKSSYALALIAYSLASLTGIVLISLTGGTSSPFIALWLLVAVFAGMFGWAVWFGVLFLANAYAVMVLITTNQLGNLELIIQLALLAEAPLLASFVIWHNEDARTGKGNQKAYKALQQQLTQVASKSEIVINSIDDGVVSIDSKGIIQLINPAAQTLLGWPKNDAIGLDFRSVIKLVNQKGAPIDDTASPIHQVMVTNKSASSSMLDLVTKSGKKIIISLVASPVSGSTEGGVIAVFRDVTLEKQEERQRGEFISTASHEMRTPVAAMEGYLALAMNPQTATIDDKARNYLQKAYESTQHLGRLFQDLLTVSRAEDGRLSPRPTVIDATAFTREIVEGLMPKAQAKQIGLYFAPGGGQTDLSKHIHPVFYVYADPSHLREVLNNLVDNAIKYTNQGTVTVDVRGDNTNVTVSITDTGIGVPPEDLTHLFQKFYRVDNSQTREIGGTGLGLYICRRLVEANNGHIGVESVFGKGSTFSIQLPRMSADQATDIMNKAAANQQTQAV